MFYYVLFCKNFKCGLNWMGHIKTKLRIKELGLGGGALGPKRSFWAELLFIVKSCKSVFVKRDNSSAIMIKSLSEENYPSALEENILKAQSSRGH